MNGVSKTRIAYGGALAVLAALCLGIGSAHAAFSAGNGAIVYVESGIIKGSDVTTPHAGNNPSISPNGNKVAFDSGGTLWTMDIDGANAVQVPGPITGTDPSWSSDGSTLAYINAGNVWTVSSSGVGATQRTASGTASGPAFSPDGTAHRLRRQRHRDPNGSCRRRGGRCRSSAGRTPPRPGRPTGTRSRSRLEGRSRRSIRTAAVRRR